MNENRATSNQFVQFHLSIYAIFVSLMNFLNCPCLIDTGSIISSIPQQMNPFPVNNLYGNVETSAGIQKQYLTKIELIIDKLIYNVMACINQGSSCILGMDILKYYTLTIDDNKAGILVKNNLILQGQHT
jgi:hypothetical protein